MKRHLDSNRGIRQAARIFGDDVARRIAEFWSFEAIDPEFAQQICDHAYGAMYSRQVLPQATRELCAVMALACLDKQPQLEVHIKAALHCGATWREVMEVLLQCHLYAGIPAQMNSIVTARAVYEQLGGAGGPPGALPPGRAGRKVTRGKTAGAAGGAEACVPGAVRKTPGRRRAT